MGLKLSYIYWAKLYQFLAGLGQTIFYTNFRPGRAIFDHYFGPG